MSLLPCYKLVTPGQRRLKKLVHEDFVINITGWVKVLCWHLIAAESSPTCVIGNSAIRSNSSSPTMSTTSKTSNEMMDRHSKYHEGRTRNKSTRTNCPPGGDEGVSFGTFLGSEIQKVLMAALISSLRVSIFPEVLPSSSTLMMIPLAGQHREPQQSFHAT